MPGPLFLFLHIVGVLFWKEKKRSAAEFFFLPKKNCLDGWFFFRVGVRTRIPLAAPALDLNSVPFSLSDRMYVCLSRTVHFDRYLRG